MNNEIGAIFGRKGTGKTTLARHLVKNVRRVLILDPLREYDGGCVIDDPVSLADYWNAVKEYPDFEIDFRPSSDRDVDAFFNVCYWSRNTWVFVDEIDRVCSPNRCQHRLRWLFNYGRHRAISLVGLARRPASVHRDFTAACDWLVAHQTSEPRDLQYLSEFMPTETLPTLEPFTWVRSGRTDISWGC